MSKYKNFLTEETIIKTIEFNKNNNLPIFENTFRPESEMFLEFFNYLRKNQIQVDDHTKFLLETDIGLTDIYEDKKVCLDLPFISDELNEEENVELNKPKRGGSKKFYVYVKNEKGNIIKVSFGDPEMDVKINDPTRRKAFAERHQCHLKKDKTKAGYWSCNLPRYAKYLGLEGGGNYYW